jgi:ubiquinone/menaquinone biosynthesis C-methylase UbiE
VASLKTTELNAVQEAARDQFARQSHRYAKGHILQDVSDVAAAVAQINLPARAQILDVATGAGNTGLYLAGLGHNVTLADIARPMLDRALEAASARGLTVKVQEHPAEKFPNASATFDLVSCRVAAHHFSAPEEFVSESARVLKPGGSLLIIDGSIQDGAPEAEEWIHQVEKLRDPSHHRFLTPGQWSRLCERAGLKVVFSKLTPFKQPDLDWYFETAATSSENRAAVLRLIESAPESARRIFGLTREEGRIVWWWERLALIARKG